MAARGSWAFDGLTLQAAATRYQHLEDIDSPGVAPGVRSDFGVPASVSHTDYERRNLTGSAVFHLGGGSELALGAEHHAKKAATAPSTTSSAWPRR